MSNGTASHSLATYRHGPAQTGPTLVLLHGLTDSGQCWPDAVRRWSPTYQILAVDALGHGSSPRFTTAELAEQPAMQMYDSTLAVVRAEVEQRGPVILVGHSMGGAIAGALAAKAPDLVRAAVLEDPAWISAARTVDPAVMAADRVAQTRAFRVDPVAAIAQGRTDNPRWPPVEIEPWAVAKADCDEGFVGGADTRLAQPWTQIAAAIAVPTLVVTGTEQTIIAASRPVLDALRNSHIQVAVVPSTGHCVRRDDPDGYHSVVDPFLAAHAAG